ncbi:MAG: hypothetical protein RL243_747 [Actinomycetota bacterium]|jgi:PHD/YefM family antitoxin component YafN of YafNO toxin-antitoxin module
MHIFGMNTVAATYARQNWAETMELAKLEPITITDHSRPAVVMMNPKLAAKALQALEDAIDVAAAIKAMASIDAGAPTVALEALAKELGIALE